MTRTEFYDAMIKLVDLQNQTGQQILKLLKQPQGALTGVDETAFRGRDWQDVQRSIDNSQEGPQDGIER
jgi:hypothetical protein